LIVTIVDNEDCCQNKPNGENFWKKDLDNEED